VAKLSAKKRPHGVAVLISGDTWADVIKELRYALEQAEEGRASFDIAVDRTTSSLHTVTHNARPLPKEEDNAPLL
jgi:hypothetical protein